MACDTSFTRSCRKHPHFHLFDHDRRFGLLNVTWTNRRAGPSTFSCVFRTQTIQPSLLRHRFDSNWRDMGQLCACDLFSIYDVAFKYIWHIFTYFSLVFPGYDVHCRRKNFTRLSFGSLQSCGYRGHVGCMFFHRPTSNHAVDKMWRLRCNRFWHAV